MNIYRCDLTLMEATFFSSREVSDLYQTEPLIGNYALAYAMGFCRAGYFSDGSILYGEHLVPLNERELYVTPGTIQGMPTFVLRHFNAQTDAYWSAFGSGFIAARSEYGWSERDGQRWFRMEADGTRKQVRPTNRPQYGRLRMLAAGNRAVAYVISREPVNVPRYIRLGKFMSKARVNCQPVHFEAIPADRRVIDHILLNPADLASHSILSTFDLVNVPPMPLVRNALIEGPFYRLVGQSGQPAEYLPQGMSFNVTGL
jgi:CRISPR-associated protein Csc1